ncbi:MAG: HNH endonuclease signature motif containing protein [Polyangiaceae bacterium]
MGQSRRLWSLADAELLAGLASVMRKHNGVTAEMLAYLAELDERQLFLDLGFSSLFEYCVDALGLCESTAGRHIAAARVCRAHPQVFAMVERGELHASALSLLKKYVTSENAGELFELCKGKSARQVEVLLAARFPRPDVQDLVRRLPAQAPLTPSAGGGGELTPNVESGGKFTLNVGSALEAADVGSAISKPLPAHAERQRRNEPLSVDRYGVHFTADSEFCDLLERVRGLVGHRLPSSDLLTLMRRGLQAYERELQKQRFAVGSKPRAARATVSGPSVTLPAAGAQPEGAQTAEHKPTPARRTRRPAAAVVRDVFIRDGEQCSYVSADGRRCTSRRCLELDHVRPWATGGANQPHNLRVLCRAHNQRYARRYFGKAHVQAAIARKRRQAAARSV